MFTISVCLIVRDEELSIDRILSQASKFANEIIVVDTGSVDRTVEIAKKYTSRVEYFEWCDEFDTARNFSFSLAEMDYIMWLDADDYISDNNIKKIIELKKSPPTTDCFMFKYSMVDDDGNIPMEFYRERLLKRSANFKWHGFVHEAITPHGEIRYLDISIEHRKIKESNPKRNLNIYRKALKSGKKFSPRETYYYSRELFYNGYYKSALKGLKSFLKMDNNYFINEREATVLIRDIYTLLGKERQGRKYLLNYLIDHSASPEICCKIAEGFALEQNYLTAIFWYNSALISPSDKLGFVEKDYTDFIPYLKLSRIYYLLGQYSIAKDYYEKAKEILPKHPSIKQNKQFF